MATGSSARLTGKWCPQSRSAARLEPRGPSLWNQSCRTRWMMAGNGSEPPSSWLPSLVHCFSQRSRFCRSGRGLIRQTRYQLPDPTRLTFDPGFQTEPTFSHDGRSIAYTSNKSGNFDIWQQPLAGGNAIPVTTDPAQDWQPDWSPDGSRIAFRSERGGGGIFVVPTTGGYEQRITEFGYRPRWSPDGSRILFRTRWFDRAGLLYLVGSKGGTTRPFHIPDAYSEKTLNSVDLEGADGWHPDGRVSLLDQPTGVVRLFTFNADDGATSRFSVDEAVQKRFRELQLTIASGEDMAWAPDGTGLYFVGISKTVRSVWMLIVDPRSLAITGGPHRLTTDTGPTSDIALSSDGLRIAYVASTLNARVWLYALDASGRRIVGAPQAVTPAEMLANTADLTLDGTKLLYRVTRHGSRTGVELRSAGHSRRPRSAARLQRHGEWRNARRSSMVGGWQAYRLQLRRPRANPLSGQRPGSVDHTVRRADRKGPSADIRVSAAAVELGIRGRYRMVARWPFHNFVEPSIQARAMDDCARPRSRRHRERKPRLRS